MAAILFCFKNGGGIEEDQRVYNRVGPSAAQAARIGGVVSSISPSRRSAITQIRGRGERSIRVTRNLSWLTTPNPRAGQ
jgi:hypothetical protein